MTELLSLLNPDDLERVASAIQPAHAEAFRPPSEISAELQLVIQEIPQTPMEKLIITVQASLFDITGGKFGEQNPIAHAAALFSELAVSTMVHDEIMRSKCTAILPLDGINNN